MDAKKEAARVACGLIKENDSVGLGDGATIRLLADYLIEKINNGFKVSLYTSSLQTQNHLLNAGVLTNDITQTDLIDVYFDGCDQIDEQLNALKSGSGIHTMEKLLASLARKFIIIGDDSKYTRKLNPSIPLVLEVIPQAARFVRNTLLSLYPACKAITRMSPQEDKPVLTINGNYLINCLFQEWPELAIIQKQCKQITGVVEISLFYQMVDEAIIADAGGIRRYPFPTDGI